jgi:hypothetical protein
MFDPDPTLAAAALASISQRFPLASVGALFEIHRRHSNLFVFEVGDEGQYVVKYEDDRSSSKVSATASHAAVLAEEVASGDARLEIVPIVGLASDPPGLVMEYVEGIDLSTIVALAASRRATDTEKARATKLVAVAGEALALIHSRSRTTSDQSDLLRRLGRRFRLRQTWKDTFEISIDPVLSAGDFAPYNIRIDQKDILHLIDIPYQRNAISVHEDCALFLAGMYRSVYELPFSHYSTSRRRFARHLKESFVAGYSSREVDLRSADHAALLDLCFGYTISNILLKLLRRPQFDQYKIAFKMFPLIAPIAVRSAIIRSSTTPGNQVK